MKTQRRFLNIGLLLFCSALVLVSCSSDDSSAEPDAQEADAQIAIETISKSDEVDLVEEEISNIALDILAVDEAEANGFASPSDFLPSCVTVTTIIGEGSRTKTVDFGAGCELPNGNILSGSFTITYTNNMEAPSKTLEVVLNDFTFNTVAVAGSKTIVRTFNSDGNPNASKVANFVATWPDGESITYTANKNREWVAGFATGFWGDNVFLLTGNVTFNNLAGVQFSKEVIEPLRREWACRFIVSGILDISRESTTVSLDFGDGSCNAFGTLTLPDGSEQEIRLRRFFN